MRLKSEMRHAQCIMDMPVYKSRIAMLERCYLAFNGTGR
jgi:hypothetical protein